MWIFSKETFISLVADRDDKHQLLVRGRVGGHIEALFPMAKVLETPKADYLFRTSMSRDTVQQVLSEKLAAIGYENFKGAVGYGDYHSACIEVWRAMHNLQGKAKLPYA